MSAINVTANGEAVVADVGGVVAEVYDLHEQITAQVVECSVIAKKIAQIRAKVEVLHEARKGLFHPISADADSGMTADEASRDNLYSRLLDVLRGLEMLVDNTRTLSDINILKITGDKIAELKRQPVLTYIDHYGNGGKTREDGDKFISLPSTLKALRERTAVGTRLVYRLRDQKTGAVISEVVRYIVRAHRFANFRAGLSRLTDVRSVMPGLIDELRSVSSSMSSSNDVEVALNIYNKIYGDIAVTDKPLTLVELY
jgi:hypothetical protein